MSTRKRILVIEDQDPEAEAIIVGLERYKGPDKLFSFSVKRVSSPREYAAACQTDESFKSGFDLYLVDLKFLGDPDGINGGFSIISNKAAEVPSGPIWVYSGYPNPENIVRAMRLGALNFISKADCDPDELPSRIADFFQRQQKMHEASREVESIVSENWEQWQQRYAGKYLILRGEEVVVEASTRIDALIAYDQLLVSNVEWPPDPVVIEVVKEEKPG